MVFWARTIASIFGFREAGVYSRLMLGVGCACWCLEVPRGGAHISVKRSVMGVVGRWLDRLIGLPLFDWLVGLGVCCHLLKS